MAPRPQVAFEEIPDVSEDSNQVVRNIVIGLDLCKKGISLPQISITDHTYTGLFGLEERLMTWARAQQSARNNGFVVWHAKYLAGCCFLVGCEMSGHRKTGNVQTTTRTTRCAVSMINEMVKQIYGAWGTAAFAVLPALAVRKYLLASVARHCEQKRSLTIPEVSRNVVQRFQTPGSPGYTFNPVSLLSSLTGEEASRIASWLGLPYVPDMATCSWSDLGLESVQSYIDCVASTAAYELPVGGTPYKPHGLPSPPPFDNEFFGMSSSMTERTLTPTTLTFDSTLGNMQRLSAIPNGRLPSSPFPSQFIEQNRITSPWPTPPRQRAKSMRRDPEGCMRDDENVRRRTSLSQTSLSQSCRSHTNTVHGNVMNDNRISQHLDDDGGFGTDKRGEYGIISDAAQVNADGLTNSYLAGQYLTMPVETPYISYPQLGKFDDQ